MAIAFRNAIGSNNAGGGTTIVITMPTTPTVSDGDVMILMITCQATGSGFNGIPSQNGWTQIMVIPGNPNTSNQTIFWKIAASEPASYTFNITAAKASAVVIALSGADGTQPVAAQLGSTGTVATQAAIPAAALGSFASTNGIDLYLGGINTGTTAAAPTNYTLPTNGQSASTGGSVSTRTTSGISYRALNGVTTVGALTATYGASGSQEFGHHVFVREAVAQVGGFGGFGMSMMGCGAL